MEDINKAYVLKYLFIVGFTKLLMSNLNLTATKIIKYIIYDSELFY